MPQTDKKLDKDVADKKSKELENRWKDHCMEQNNSNRRVVG